ncbi:hypothetical protein GX865_02105 [Candidatus Saccharibacteria bacterium]|nr:hypothetical protein [Candidatus Saccharibacteria bacterium]
MTVSTSLRDSIAEHFKGYSILLRGVQSAYHDISREDFIKEILRTGTDRIGGQESLVDDIDFYAAYYDSFSTDDDVARLFGGFHTFKPKCEQRPQYPADIWLVYDATRYMNVSYIHPRHNVVARDGWRLAKGSNMSQTLKAIYVIN